MNPRRVVIAGAGAMGRAWGGLVASRGDLVLAGWVDPDGTALDRARDAIGRSDFATDGSLADLLARVPCDFVLDVTPPDVHEQTVVTALRAGRPVLGEKPMSDGLDAARRMVRASEESGLLYMVSQSRRYNAQLAAFRAGLAALGGAEILDVDFYIGPHFGGFREEIDSPLLADMAIHTFDAARYLTGRDAVSVYAEEFDPSWSWYRGAASARAFFTMEGGARFSYRGSWCAEGLPTSWEGVWRGVARGGTATWDGANAPVVGRPGEPQGLVWPTVTETLTVDAHARAGGIEGALDEFLAALESGDTPACECHDNFRSLAMVHAAIASGRAGAPVAVPAI